MPELTLIIANKNYSSWSMRPWLVLKHFAIPFTEKLIPLDPIDSPYRSEKYREYSEAGKVPMLIADDQVIWDSLSIMEYLAETYPEMHLWPADKKARAYARSMVAEMHSSFFHLRSEMPMNIRRKPSKIDYSKDTQVNIDRICRMWIEAIEIYNPEKKGGFLFGDFTIADAMFAPVVARFIGYSVEVFNMAKEYMQNITNLPAYKEWQEAALQEEWILEHAEK